MRNFIFDWSGTLVDDVPPVLRATNAIFAHFGKPAFTRESFLGTFKLPFVEFYAEQLPGIAMEDIEPLYVKNFGVGVQDVTVLPHAREFLEFCAKSGRRMFVLSSTKSAHFNEQALALGLDHFFEVVFAEVWDKKEKIHEILETMGLDPAETAFVGDMVHDVETARHGGVTSVAVLTGYDNAAKLCAAEPDVTARDLSHLRRVLEGNDPLHTMPVSTVGALIFNVAGAVLMVQTHKWSNKWGIPGGKIKRGESSEDALRREILEETGLAIEDVRFVMVQDCVEPAEFMRSAHFLLLNYTARCVGSSDVILNDEAEEFVWATLTDAAAMDLNIPTRVLLENVMASGQSGNE
jgi:phosphoglycolate phosphatase